jgi:hypothetical protein
LNGGIMGKAGTSMIWLHTEAFFQHTQRSRQVVYGLKLLGRSSHGASDRSSRKMPFKTYLSSTDGMPRALFGNIGLIVTHSSPQPLDWTCRISVKTENHFSN